MPPAKTTSSSGLKPGDEAEARVGQLWFWEGYYARTGIDLRRHYHPEPLLVTDLDLLAFDLTPSLEFRKTIGETKTGKGRSAPKPLDRIVWLRGLMELVSVDAAELVTSIEPSSRARALARSLGVRAQSLQDVERRERAISVRDVQDLGSQGCAAAEIRHRVHKVCNSEPHLERAFWFLRSEVWFLDSSTAAKRTIGLYRQLSLKWTPAIDDDEQTALRWLLAECVSVLVLHMVELSSGSLVEADEQFAANIEEQLSAGIASADALRRIASDVDKFVAGLLNAAGASNALKAEAMGAIYPEPPEWSEAFVETLRRMATDPVAARVLPRQVDLIIFERLVHRRHLKPVAVSRLGVTDEGTGRLVRLVAAFLRGQVAEIEEVDRALTAPLVPVATRRESPSRIAQQALLEMEIKDGDPPSDGVAPDDSKD